MKYSANKNLPLESMIQHGVTCMLASYPSHLSLSFICAKGFYSSSIIPQLNTHKINTRFQPVHNVPVTNVWVFGNSLCTAMHNPVGL